MLAFSTLCAACGATPAATTGPVGSRAEGAPEALAVVNGVAIGRAAFDEAARRVASDRRDALTEDEQRRVLDLLIDEELLVQHGLDSGLARDDRRVRAAIVASVMEREKSFPCLGDCTGDELRKFYEDHPDLFRTTARLAVRTLWFSERRPEAALRARQALGELRTGADPDEVAARLADDEIAPPPSAPMPPDKLADYIGAEGAHAAEETPLGAWSDPVAVPGGVRLIFVVSREAGAMRPFAEVEDRIRYEAQQFAAERAVQNLIRDLRAKAKIEVDPDISKGVEK
ncbi:MAG: peptidyl-prolyl cis-trans isomerase [Deltaproteobacteria bacterium]|nr:peptidyl-prolyl cis-trans isomerase [Deltaproteobacteria bacterium]